MHATADIDTCDPAGPERAVPQPVGTTGVPLSVTVTGDLPSRPWDTPTATPASRRSTLDQDPALQVDALEAAGCERILIDKASGKLARRSQLELLRETVLPGDTVMVWRLDRLGRSMPHLLEVVGELGQHRTGRTSVLVVMTVSVPGTTDIASG